MFQMLYEICQEIKNFFVQRDTDVHEGHFRIKDGRLYEWDGVNSDDGLDSEIQFLQNGQFFRVLGSVFNDGVYRYPAGVLIDENFEGAVWAMRVPPALIALAADIEDWKNQNAKELNSPYQSESFGGYSYSLRSGGSTATGSNALTWQSQFATRLNKWRKINVL